MSVFRCGHSLKFIIPNFIIKQEARNVHRWVGPTLSELRCRRKKFQTEVYSPRNTYIEWNPNAEIYAFGQRLNEKFDAGKLQQAFVDRSYIIQEELKQQKLGIEEPVIGLNDNRELVQIGEKLTDDYLKSYLEYSLPKCPDEGIQVFHQWLTSQQNLAKISYGIGTKDLILCLNNEPTEKILRDTLLAVIGALYESSGEEKSYYFIRDFICTQLNQIDLTEIWEIQNPLNVLQQYCELNNLNEPEPRLLGECGKNTVLSAYHVGIYSNKKLLGKGFGESIKIAIDTASLDALHKFYDIHDRRTPFSFNLKFEKDSRAEKITQNLTK